SESYYRLMAREGITPQYAKLEMRRRTTLIGAMLLKKGEADGMICGTVSTTTAHLRYIDQVLGGTNDVYAAMNGLVLPGRQIFLVDTHVNIDPTAEELAEITIMAAEELKRFGIEPKVALLSHSNFGSSDSPSSIKMRKTLAILRDRAPDLEVDGEMHGDSALDQNVRDALVPDGTLKGEANLLVCPNIDSANISYNLLKAAAGNNVAIGPILLGAKAPVHILTPSATVRRILNQTALVVVKAAAK
ncbi:Phosphotransacetylase, partial [Cupriavidus sp. YR651]|uniref:phosphate acyltransferase n=1 Tax=Cupriavidus sp. YR651 TaxID=1855315 RepID=UPI00088DE5DA